MLYCCIARLQPVTGLIYSVLLLATHAYAVTENLKKTRVWANAQRDGRPAEYRWRPLFNAAKFG